MKLYAAYGSNMNRAQMLRRCPDAKTIATAAFLGHRIVFRGANGMAIATVEPDPEEWVPVLLWEISPKDERRLDSYEGFPVLYEKETITVALPNGKDVSAMTYALTPGKQKGLPSLFYYNIIAEGYIENGFGEEPLAKLLDAATESAIGRTTEERKKKK